MLFVPLSGALYEGYAFSRCAIRRASYRAVLGHLFHHHVRYNVRELTEAIVVELVRIIRLPAARHDDRAGHRLDRALRRSDCDYELTRLPSHFLHLRRGVDFDIGVTCDLAYNRANTRVFELRERIPSRDDFMHLVHKTAELGFLLDQDRVVAGLCNL